MRKRILVKEAGFMDFIKSFFKAKSQGKEKQYIASMRKVNPDLADAWADWDTKADNLLHIVKKNFIRLNMPEKAAEVDALINKYN